MRFPGSLVRGRRAVSGSTVAVAVFAAASMLFSAAAEATTLTPFSTTGTTALITDGPDGNLWFTESNPSRIGTLTPAGSLTEYSTGISTGAAPKGIVTGPDGKLWFTEPGVDKVGVITTKGDVTEYGTGITAGARPDHIAVGPDGNLWFTEPGMDGIGTITQTGTVTEFRNGITAGGRPTGIAAGPDGRLWFTEPGANKVGAITTSGTVTEYSSGITTGAAPLGITAGTDGNLWLAESGGSGTVRVGRITPTGTVSEFFPPFNATAPTEITTAGNDVVYAANSALNTNGELGRVTPTGMVGRYVVPFGPSSPTLNPTGIVDGPDGKLWATSGDQVVMVTLGQPATATTGAADGITETAANLHGTVNQTGSGVAYEFQYGADSNYGQTTTSRFPFQTTSGSGAVAVSRSLSNLAQGTLFHYRLSVTNIDGTAYGADQTFMTASAPVPPSVTTNPTNKVASDSATVTATVNPNGAPTDVTVVYAPTGGGTLTRDLGTITGGSQTVTGQLTGLQPGSVYTYNFDAFSSAGTGSGTGHTLTTFTSVADGQPGSLDSSFGTGGQTAFDFGSTTFSAFDAIARQSDGKLVMAGSSDQPTGQRWAVARVKPDGTPDSSFGTNGVVLLAEPGSSPSASGVAAQADGKIVVAGDSTVARLNGDGSLDTSFNGTGTASVAPMSIAAAAIQPSDQRVLVAGTAGGPGASTFALARLNPDGTADSSFGNGGLVTTSFGAGASRARALKVQEDGKIVAAGFAGGTFAAARYNPDGSLDSGFGSGGEVTPATPGGGSASAAAALLQADGNLILAGSDTGGNVDLTRLNPDGSPDTTFGTSGGASFSVPGTTQNVVNAAAFDYGGFTLLAGSVQMDGERHGFLARVTPTGAIDTTFGQNGFDTYVDTADFGVIIPPAPPQAATSAPLGPDPPSTTDAAAAGTKVTATDPQGGTPTRTSGSTEAVNDAGPASCMTPQRLNMGQPLLTTPPTPVTDPVTVTNCGSSDLTIDTPGVGIAAPSFHRDFQITSDACSGMTLHPGQSCTFEVQFTPRGDGVYSAAVFVFDGTGAREALEVEVAPFAAGKSCLSPDPIHFGTVSTDSPAGQTVTLSNCGSAPITIVGDAFWTNTNADLTFSSGNCSNAKLGPGESCTFHVVYGPTGNSVTRQHGQSDSGQLEIQDTGNDSPEVLHWDGTPVRPQAQGGTGCSSGSGAGCCQSGTGTGCCQSSASPPCCDTGTQSCCPSQSSGCCTSQALDCCTSGTGPACQTVTSDRCVASPFPRVLDRLLASLGVAADDKEAIARIEAALRRKPGPVVRSMLTREDNMLHRNLRQAGQQIVRVDRGVRSAGGATASLAAASGIPASDVVDGFAEAAKAAVKSKLEADKAAGRISSKDFDAKLEKANKLVDQLKTLGKLGTDATISDAEKQQIVEDAVVGLIGEFAGKDSEELAGEMKTLIKALRGKLSEKEKKKILEKKIPALVQKLVKAAGGDKALGKSVKELTEQIQTLVKLTLGDPLSDEEKAAIFNQAVLGLLERTVFNGYLDPLFLKAATLGFDFAKPFGDAIARGLRTAASRQIYSAAETAMAQNDAGYVETISQDHGKVIQVKIEGGSFGGWMAVAYWDNTAMQVVLKVVPPEDKMIAANLRAFFRALVGSKEFEWIFDPSTCEETQKGSVLEATPR